VHSQKQLFFSSRRRHTRFSRDWSSDVCSSDLAVPVRAKVSITEITGSESFVHLDFADVRWVMLAHGIHHFQPDEQVEVFIEPRHVMVFDAAGKAVTAQKLAA